MMLNGSNQKNLDDTDATRNLLDQLLTDSRLFTQSKDYMELLDFVVHLRNFAPFNAMLLQIQKPGLSYAASACDWRERFDRKPKLGARPLLILWPFGPVAFVYDVLDTEGKALPEGVFSFYAQGSIDNSKISSFITLMNKKNIQCQYIDAGDRNAGLIGIVNRASKDKEKYTYKMFVNKNHFPAVQFATIAHELAHLFLGHLGYDKALNVPDRNRMYDCDRELEAESVAYLVCARNGVSSKSETYLKDYVTEHTKIDDIDIYQIMRASGQIETLLELTAHTKFDKPKNK